MLRQTALGNITFFEHQSSTKPNNTVFKKPSYFAASPIKSKHQASKDAAYDLSVEELNIPEATVHCRIVGSYTRDDEMNLRYVEGRFANVISNHWYLFANSLANPQSAEPVSEHGVTVRKIALDEDTASLPPAIVDVFQKVKATNIATHDSFIFRVAEIQAHGECQYRGIIMVDGPMSDFDEWFEALILSEAHLAKAALPVHENLEVEAVVEKITNIFDKELRNVTHDDMWNQGGRVYFADRVRFFVSRNTTIEACLPAFPCKSSNTMKVAGDCPDKGEELALRRILAFAKMIQTVYTPGIKVWIVSDGHVFSDCIGVDDGVVDRYGEQLKQLYRQISKENTIGFRSLPELFTSSLGQFDQSYTSKVALPHYLNTEIKAEAEVCREILMCGCSTDPAILRGMIDANDPAKIALYRGFSKFMLEDLAEQPATFSLGNKARRKLASKVAFEMIKRNEAYSNLVGLLLPYHLRLSIHAHNNSGPKFGIRLLSHDKVRTVKSLTFEELQSSDDLLHIPTPWHNCVVEIENKDCYYVFKSKVVKDALVTDDFSGEWVQSSYGEGGRSVLKPTEQHHTTSSSESDSDLADKLDSMSLSNTSSSSCSFSDDSVKVPLSIGILMDDMLRASDALHFAEVVSVLQKEHPGIEAQLLGNDIAKLEAIRQTINHGINNLEINTVEKCGGLDVLYMPGLKTLGEPLSFNLCNFVSTKYDEVEYIISPGTGVLALSKSGILDGKGASICESKKQYACRTYENVMWVTEPWTFSHKVWTSSNLSGSNDVIMHFVKEAYGEATANKVKFSMGY